MSNDAMNALYICDICEEKTNLAMSCGKPYRSGGTPAFLQEVRHIDRGVGGVERGIISSMYYESEVDGVGVSRVRVGRSKGLDMNGIVGTTPSLCFFLLTYTSPYLDSP
jgi:hypothetical protein